METIENLKAQGEALGYEDHALRAFIKDQQDRLCDERKAQREAQARERELAEAKEARERELAEVTAVRELKEHKLAAACELKNVNSQRLRPRLRQHMNVRYKECNYSKTLSKRNIYLKWKG